MEDDQAYEEAAGALGAQLGGDERVLEALLLILVGNERTECELLPCLQALIKVQSQGMSVFRSKVINALTFLLKSLATNDREALAVLLPSLEVDARRTALLLIGTLRILLRNNRALMKHVLKGLVLREEPPQKQLLRKQLKALKTRAAQQEGLEESPKRL